MIKKNQKHQKRMQDRGQRRGQNKVCFCKPGMLKVLVILTFIILTAGREENEKKLLGMKEMTAKAAEMEMGGFDIAVGEGMAEDFFENVSPDFSGAENDSYNGGTEEERWDQEDWDVSESFSDFSSEPKEDNSGKDQQNFEQDFDFIQNQNQNNTQSHVQESRQEGTLAQQEHLQIDKSPEKISPEKINKEEISKEKISPEKINQERKSSSENEVSNPQIGLELSPKPKTTPEPDHNSADKAVAEPTKKPLLSPKTTKKKEEQLQDSVSELLFYKKDTAQERKKSRFLIYHKKETTDLCEAPQFRFISQCPVYILSVRINKKECLWYWEEDRLILQGSGEKKENNIELIALYEEGTVQAVFQNGIA